MYNRHIRHLILLCLSLHRLEIRDGERVQLRFLIRIRTLQFEPLAIRMHFEMVRQATLDNLKVPEMFRTILLAQSPADLAGKTSFEFLSSTRRGANLCRAKRELTSSR